MKPALEKPIMVSRLLNVCSRICLGIVLILNGPANVLAIGVVSLNTACPCAGEAKVKTGKKCCGRCAKGAKTAAEDTKPKDGSDHMRPTCPVCPSCPNVPSDGCCVSCPCKAPCAPPLVFAIPATPELVWQLTDGEISLFDSHADEPILPPRFLQFVAFTI